MLIFQNDTQICTFVFENSNIFNNDQNTTCDVLGQL
jgi:hypothetical protein